MCKDILQYQNTMAVSLHHIGSKRNSNVGRGLGRRQRHQVLGEKLQRPSKMTSGRNRIDSSVYIKDEEVFEEGSFSLVTS